MTGKIYHPEDKHPEPYQQDMNPDAAVGQNRIDAGPHPEKGDHPTAHDIKELHRRLQEYTDDELKRIPVLPRGTRLEQGKTYIDLNDAARAEFTARADMEAGPDQWIVPKSEVDYVLWNRLIGVTDPARLDERRP
ncbi:MAG TPA: hypothetical protein VF590_19060 [Isosphaeraceae bacterium]|jgi:hypothetical protein